MVAISFSVFKDKILSGEKRQTIRIYSEKRYNQIMRIRTLQLYWHQRSRDSELLREEIAVELFRMRFIEEGDEIGLETMDAYGEFEVAKENEREHIAQADGFSSWAELVQWFINRYGRDKLLKTDYMVIRW